MRFAIPDLQATRRPRRRLLSTLLLGCVGCVLLAAAPVVGAQDTIPSPPITDTIPRNIGTVRAGDLLALVVFQHPELSGAWPVDARGYVNIPGIGAVRVAGLAPDELPARLKAAMTPRILNPEFTVAVQIRVFVIGEVGRPGLH